MAVSVNLIFDAGEREAPKGHALVYFRDRADPERYLVTYLVILPVAIDPSRYVPQALAGRASRELTTVNATALPPIPEPVDNLEQLRAIAQHRGDDVLDGGTIDTDEVERLIYVVHEMTQAYEQLYRAAADHWAVESVAEPDTETVQLLLMSELDRLEELARLTGQLRYAVDGQDTRLAERDGNGGGTHCRAVAGELQLARLHRPGPGTRRAQPATGGAAAGSLVQAVQRRVRSARCPRRAD